MEEFDNAKDALDYMVEEAKENEVIKLDLKATSIHPRRVKYYRKFSDKARNRKEKEK